MVVVDEDTPLLRAPPTNGSPKDNEEQRRATERANKLVVYASFLGIFLAAADDSIVMSTWSSIASQFHRLSQGSWLLVAYNFGYCVSLPMYGILSNMYGRKNVLLWANSLFAIGSVACGISHSMVQLVLARVMAGISGGGMIAMVSIIITDLIPSHEVALLRSYANVVNVLGRSLGAPFGGFLIQSIGWRWSFLCQLPLIAICILVAKYGLPSSLNEREADEESDNSPKTLSELDFVGLVFFAAATVILLFLLQSASDTTVDQSRLYYILVPAFVVALVGFALVEGLWAKKPLIPLDLLNTSLGGYCIVQVLMVGGRQALISNLVPYFVRVKRASELFAASSYVITSLGLSIGGVFAGAMIKRTKGHKKLTVFAVITTLWVYLLIFLRWRNGCEYWETIYLFPNGFAIGMLFSTQFIGMSFGAPKGSLEVCITTYYLFQQLGFIIGPASGIAVVQHIFGSALSRSLEGLEEKKLIGQILNDARFSETLSGSVQDIIRSCYLYAFQFLPVIAAVCAAIMLLIVLWIKERRAE